MILGAIHTSLFLNKLPKAIGGLLFLIGTELFGWIPIRGGLTLLGFIALDTVLGAGIAIAKRSFSALKFRSVVLKLLIYWLTLLVVTELSRANLLWEQIFGTALMIWTLGYLLASEAISVIEKLGVIAVMANIDIPVLTLIIKRLESARDAKNV